MHMFNDFFTLCLYIVRGRGGEGERGGGGGEEHIKIFLYINKTL